MVAQGEIYWVNAKDLDVQGTEQQKSRPYIIVSRTAINKLGKNVVGVPLTTRVHKACAHRVLIPLHMMIKDSACQRTLSDSVALTDHIRVLDVDRLEHPRMGSLTQTAMGGVEDGLAYLFDIR